MEGAEPLAVVQISKAGTSERFSYKNRLQELAQKSAIPMPLYHTINGGTAHEPQFRSCVFVEGTTFESSHMFRSRKEAEQDVARVAVEGIALKIKHEGVTQINTDTTFCKGILHEYASKLNIGSPKYTTTGSKGLLSLFITSVDFNGRTYKGNEGRNKKEAEQLAARAVIESILGCSDSGTLMAQIIKSKGRLYAALRGSNFCLNQEKEVAFGGLIENHSTIANSIVKEKEVQGALTNGKLSSTAHSETFFPVQSADTVKLNSVITESRNPRKEHMREAIGLPGSDTSQPANTQGNLPAGLTGTLVVPVLDESHVAQCTQVKKEFPFDDPSVVSNEPKSVTPSSGQKRARKNETEYHHKKARADEQPSAAPGECNNGNGV